MVRLVLFLFAASALFGADNPWMKVQALPGRSELRIYKKGSNAPLVGTLADANDERIVVAVDAKKQQLTILRDEIDRIDARPLNAPGSKKTVTTTEKTTDPDYTPKATPGPALPETSSSTNVTFGSKPDFKTVYVRPSSGH